MEAAVTLKKASDLSVAVGELGTKNIDEVLDLFEEGVDDTVSALSDGSISWTDLFTFRGMLEKVGPALEGLDQLLPEVKDLDGAEAGRLFARVVTIWSKLGKLLVKKA